MQIETTMTEELEQWGWWVQDCPVRSLNYPNSEPYAVTKGGIALSITDERAIEIDRAIAYLFNGDENAITAIKLRFVCGFSFQQIGDKVGMSRDRSRRLVEDSVSWLTGYFVGRRKSA